MPSLVSTDWLAKELGSPDLVVLDASAHLPDAGRDPEAEFLDAHIPGARYFDLPNLFDKESPVPSAIPSRTQFVLHMAKLGVRETDRVVFYDDSYVKTSARAWFICRMMGMHRVAVLDGGLGKWHREGRPVESGSPAFEETPFVANGALGTVRTKSEMLANIDSKAEVVVDARGAKRFTGEDKDFRPNVADGHIPGARNLPFDKLFNEDGTYKQPEAILQEFRAAGVDLDQPVATTCGGGVTAAVLLFGLHQAGKDDVALYDGSWSEWGTDPDLPKELGEAR